MDVECVCLGNTKKRPSACYGEDSPFQNSADSGLPIYTLNYQQQDEITLGLNSLVPQNKYFEAL